MLKGSIVDFGSVTHVLPYMHLVLVPNMCITMSIFNKKTKKSSIPIKNAEKNTKNLSEYSNMDSTS